MSDYAKQNGQSPAHPEQLVEDCDGLFVPASRFAECGGMTKREMFAGVAMQGLLSGGYRCATQAQYAIVAEHATRYADALLAELANEAD